ncbi:MAG: hypothetical protein A2085_03960 [Gemmatimonadetes bacterium GWC2_71_10]|nr:MAG: hypothetical protein A2085_03960 [Gemmatimonadetes bacterium GWC2_71_10]
MGRINVGRVVGGGLLAGLVLNVQDFLVHGVMLKADWEQAMTALGKPGAMNDQAVAVFVVIDFLIGIWALWLYAAMRPRFGPGPRTAVIAGLTAWVVFALFTVSQMPMGLFSTKLLLLPLAIALVVAPLAVAAGAYLYKEEEAGVMAPA